MKGIIIFISVMAAALILPSAARAYADAAAGACVMNALTGEVVFEKNADARLPMASTTKIMTLIAALERSDGSETVTVSAFAAAAEGSSAYIEPGMTISMEALEYGLMLNSGNDAAVAIAEHISGGTEEFAAVMNETAARLGAANTRFMNPNGLDQDGHYTTARDLAAITRYAMRNERFRRIVSAKTYTAEFRRSNGSEGTVEYINHNRLLGELEGCVGVKTGYTKADGRCLVSAVSRGGAEYVIVTLNDPDDWNEHKRLAELAFSGCRVIRAVSAGGCVGHAVSGGKGCDLAAAENFDVPVNGKAHDIDVVPHIPKLDGTPLNKGEKVGYVEIFCGGESIGVVDAVAKTDFYAEGSITVRPCLWTAMVNLIKSLL